jgi:hypothetical protein
MDLSTIEGLGSVKLYTCWYDQYQITDEEWKGVYPCCETFVHVKDVIDIVNEVLRKPHTVTNNDLRAQQLHAFFMDKKQDECEKYVEVSLLR